MKTMRRLVTKMLAPSSFALCLMASALFEAAAGPQGDPCDSGWVGDLFPAPAGMNGSVKDLLVFDDGSGPALFAGGSFTQAGGLPADRVAKWDGEAWSALAGGGPNFPVNALELFDDGSGAGPALYAGGGYLQSYGRVSKWNGQTWTQMGPDFDDTILAIAAFDAAPAPSLYAAGAFQNSGSIPSNTRIKRIARWNGSQWVPIGLNANHTVECLSLFDDGSGTALFVGGKFKVDGGSGSGAYTDYIAKFTGGSWSALGVNPNHEVYALAVFDDGTGPALFVGGFFNGAGAAPASRIAKWDGAAWSPLGAGVDDLVYSLAALDGGDGTKLYVGGLFDTAGGIAANGLARWDGSSWTPAGSGTNGSVSAMTTFDDGNGSKIYLGGGFNIAGGNGARGVARGDGQQWEPVGDGMDFEVHALDVHDDQSGEGPALYVAGNFRRMSGVNANGVAKWDGESWSALGSGLGRVFCLAEFDDGAGPSLYAGGQFSVFNGDPFDRIARWDGNNWSSVGGGANDIVRAMAVFDDGSGPQLYVGGDFGQVGGMTSPNIAKWNGAAWTPVAGLSTGPVACGRTIQAMLVFDDGSGSALYAGGKFGLAGGMTANHIAKWNGASWSTVGTGFPNCSEVRTLAAYDDGSGAAIYAGGVFKPGSGVNGHIAKWDGAAWTPFGGDLSADVLDLAVFDDGSGPALYAAGKFAVAGGVTANRLAKWNGTNWSALGSGTDGETRALCVFDDGTGPALFVGGAFAKAGQKISGRLAKWTGCAAVPPQCLGDGNGDNMVNFDDVSATIANWLVNYGAGTGPGDTNGDGIVNFDDISTTIANWLVNCGA